MKFWAVWGLILSTETPGTDHSEIHRTVAGFPGEACRRKMIARKGESGKGLRPIKP